MKQTIGLLILVWAFSFPYTITATNVEGIIDTNTAWELKDSPFTITNEITGELNT